VNDIEVWNLRLGAHSNLTTHDEFRALCAISTSGSLREDERSKLEEHLLRCPECRKALQEYERVARIVMPSLVPDFPADPGPLPDAWSEERAKQELFRQLDVRKPSDNLPLRLLWSRRREPVKFAIARRQQKSGAWLHPVRGTLQYAAAIALFAMSGWWGYQMGEKRGASPVSLSQRPALEMNGPRDGIAAINRERELLRAQLRERDHAIADLTGKTARQLAEIRDLKNQELKNEDHEAQDSYRKTQEEDAHTASELDGLRHKVEQAQSDLAAMQTEMASLRQQRASEAARAAELETRLGQLPDLLKDRDSTIEQQRELLSRDRDIRDLMGARDLYIAEVIDVGRDGETKKPFGRVFYTKGKSLIFYAYDLDQQPSLREASTFQAWGRRGPDMAEAMNLGIFYVDNTTHKRWVLKFDDPKSLDQIDAVFVTVEPKGGSRKPSGKQLLFAYLRVEPNHP
jgi:hypothetical protein